MNQAEIAKNLAREVSRELRTLELDPHVISVSDFLSLTAHVEKLARAVATLAAAVELDQKDRER